jgi:phosphoserine phosphatase
MAYVATLIATEDIPSSSIDEFENVVRRERATVLRPQTLCDNRAMDYYLDVDSSTVTELKRSLYELSDKLGIDIILQKAESQRSDKGLVVFDMDSTLIEQEVIDVIASYAGLEEQVSKITAAAMNGEIDFNESLIQRAALLKGISSDVFEELKSRLSFTPGARELTRVLRKKGAKLAVLSGGFVPLANWVKEQLGLDYAYANVLEVSEDGSELNGQVSGQIVNSSVKAALLQEIAEKEKIEIDRVVAIGDGSNDLEMMQVAGFGIAFNAKPVVQQRAPSRLNTRSLQDVLYIFGYTREEQEALLL